jgi:hypothetical protein
VETPGLKELIRDITNGKIDGFSDLAPHDQTTEGAQAWFDVKMAFLNDSDQETIEAYYDEIPQALRSHAVHLRLVKNSPLSIARITPTTELEYCALISAAVTTDPASINLVDPAYQTERTLQLVLPKSSFTLNYVFQKSDWVRRELTPALVDLSAQTGVNVLLAVDESLISNNALDYLLSNHLDKHAQVRRAGKLHLLSKGIEQGYWPRGRLNGKVSKPTCLPAAVRMLLCATCEDTEALYLACVKTYPVGKVVRHLKGPLGRKFLLEAYTTDELSPHLKQMDSSLKGVLLGSALGL